MASILTGSIVADISGKVNANVYSRNRGGAYVKAWAAPTQSTSYRANNARTNMADATTAWAALTDDARLEWNALAATISKPSRIGVMRKISGKALFLKRYLFLAGNGQSTSIGPYNDPIGTAIRSFSISLSTTAMTSTVHPTVSSASAVAFLAVSPYLPATVMSPNSTFYRNIRGGNSLQGGATRSILSDVTSLNGSPAGHAGEKLFVKATLAQVLFLGRPSPHRSGQFVETPFFASGIIAP